MNSGIFREILDSLPQNQGRPDGRWFYRQIKKDSSIVRETRRSLMERCKSFHKGDLVYNAHLDCEQAIIDKGEDYVSALILKNDRRVDRRFSNSFVNVFDLHLIARGRIVKGRWQALPNEESKK